MTRPASEHEDRAGSPGGRALVRSGSGALDARQARQPHRLPPRDTEVIGRDAPVSFRFAGKVHAGYAGDTISSALWAAGVRVLGRSFKYHRPRGDLSLSGSDPNALVQIGDEPNVRAGVRRIEEGMEIAPQNVAPSLRFDVLAINGLFSRFLPVGFYYKAFHSRRLWPVYERLIRRAAGLGRVFATTPEGDYDKQYRHTDVAVIGAGPAGLSAALAAADAGADVLVLERDDTPGGFLRFGPAAATKPSGLARLAEEAAGHERITILTGATAMGYYDGHYLSAFTERRLYKIRARSLVVATGAVDRLPVFGRNDLPGILTGEGALRLLNLYAVRPGQKIAVLAAGAHGHEIALELAEAGIETEVIDERGESEAGRASWAVLERLRARGVPCRFGRRIETAHGRRAIRAVELGAADGSRERVACDALVLCQGLHPNAGILGQAGARLEFRAERREFVLGDLPPRVHAAGSVAGTHDLQAAADEGRISGLRAAESAGVPAPGASLGTSARDLARRKQALPAASGEPPAPDERPATTFRFVDLAEDVTEKDLRDAIGEGYDSSELLKRYTTVSMGPDQGRHTAAGSTLLAAELQQKPAASVALTSSRPPAYPVKIGTMAGRVLAPLRRTPIHHRHEERVRRWLHPGLWRRPDTYRDEDPAETVRRVRRGVGLIDVSTLGKVFLYGRDVRELLSRIYTNKWRKLPVGKCRYGVMCNEEGAIIDDGVTGRLGENTFYMSLTTPNSGSVPQSILWWQAAHFGLDVHLASVTTAHGGINVAGPEARSLLQRVTGDIDLSDDAFPFMGVRKGRVAGVEAILLRIGFTGELSYEVHMPAGHGEHVWDALLDAGQDLGVTPVGQEALNILRLEKGHILVGQDTDAHTTPLEAGLSWAVKTDKEDFVGKAGILRRERQGLSRALVGFEMADPSVKPAEGALVLDPDAPRREQKIGWVTSARVSPTLEASIGMAWVPREMREPGTPLAIQVNGHPAPARTVTTPFFDPEGSRLREPEGSRLPGPEARERGDDSLRKPNAKSGVVSALTASAWTDPATTAPRIAAGDGWVQIDRFAAVEDEALAVRDAVGLCDASACGKLLIQGKAIADALAEPFGAAPERTRHIQSLGPRWIVKQNSHEYYASVPLAEEEDLTSGLRAAFAGRFAHVTSLTHGRDALVLAGPRAPEALAKLCSLDLRSTMFPDQNATVCALAKISALVARRDRGAAISYEIHVDRSFGAYLWDALADAIVEFGGRPVGMASLPAANPLRPAKTPALQPT